MGNSVLRLRSAVALLSSLALGACGDSSYEKSSPPKASPSAPSGTTPPATSGTPAMATPPSDPAAPAPAGASWTGTVEKVGISIHMQGTHKLVDGAKTVVLLQSSTVDLTKHEGKRVTVTGTASPTVEGNATIVNVLAVTP